MNEARLALIVILVAAFVLGCAAPAPLVRLDPRGTRGFVWVAGRAVMEKEQGGVRVASAFEVQDGSLLALRLEIQNLTEGPIEVGPEGFTFMTCRTGDNGSCSGSYGVVDPEAMLARFDERQSLERAVAHNQQALDTTLFFLSAATDLAAIGSGRATSTTGLGTVMMAEQAQSDAARAQVSLSTLASGRQSWSSSAFRRTTLPPGQGAGGFVYLPIDKSARYVWVHVRAGGQIIPFGFRQSVRQVRLASSGGARR